MLIKRLFAHPMNPAGDDGSDTGGGDTVGTGNDARIAILERINDMNDGVRADELADVNDDDTTSPFEATVVESKDEENPETPEPVAASTDDADAALEEELFPIKVNGKEFKLTRAQLIERAQKVEAADTYLAEAARIKREAEKPEIAPPSFPKEAGLTPDDRRALVRAIQMGTEEEAMAALEKLQSPRGPSQDDLSRTVDERLNFKEAVSKFQSNYSDILDDPVLRDLALRRDQDALAAGDKRDYWTRYQAIGEDLRAWKAGLTSVAAPKETPAAETKQARKAAAAPALKAASAKAPAAAQDDDREESVADVIAGIAKARGGPQWARA